MTPVAMTATAKLFVVFGALNGFLAVVLGAFGAHALRQRLSESMLSVYGTATQYHFYHALALCFVGLAIAQLPNEAALKWSGWLMLIGIFLFSGSLYLLSMTSTKWLGAVTPLGGLAWLLGWLALALGVWRSA